MAKCCLVAEIQILSVSRGPEPREINCSFHSWAHEHKCRLLVYTKHFKIKLVYHTNDRFMQFSESLAAFCGAVSPWAETRVYTAQAGSSVYTSGTGITTAYTMPT
ncbi:hypothetical protein ACRRTK_017228 [Alexandromys fortis]